MVTKRGEGLTFDRKQEIFDLCHLRDFEMCYNKDLKSFKVFQLFLMKFNTKRLKSFIKFNETLLTHCN